MYDVNITQRKRARENRYRQGQSQHLFGWYIKDRIERGTLYACHVETPGIPRAYIHTDRNYSTKGEKAQTVSRSASRWKNIYLEIVVHLCAFFSSSISCLLVFLFDFSHSWSSFISSIFFFFRLPRFSFALDNVHSRYKRLYLEHVYTHNSHLHIHV